MILLHFAGVVPGNNAHQGWLRGNQYEINVKWSRELLPLPIPLLLYLCLNHPTTATPLTSVYTLSKVRWSPPGLKKFARALSAYTIRSCKQADITKWSVIQNGYHLRSVENGIVDREHGCNSEYFFSAAITSEHKYAFDYICTYTHANTYFSAASSIFDSIGPTGNSAILRPSYKLNTVSVSTFRSNFLLDYFR